MNKARYKTFVKIYAKLPAANISAANPSAVNTPAANTPAANMPAANTCQHVCCQHDNTSHLLPTRATSSPSMCGLKNCVQYPLGHRCQHSCCCTFVCLVTIVAQWHSVASWSRDDMFKFPSRLVVFHWPELPRSPGLKLVQGLFWEVNVVIKIFTTTPTECLLV